MANINEMLAQLISQAGSQVLPAAGQAATATLPAGTMQQAGKNFSDTPGPLGVLSALIQQMGTPAQAPQNNSPIIIDPNDPNAHGGSEIAAKQKIQLSPAQEAAKSAIKDNIYADVDKQIKSGGSAQQIEEHFGLSQAPTASAQQSNPGSQPVTRDEVLSFIADYSKQQGGQQQQAPQQQNQILPANGFFSGGGVDANNNVTDSGLGRKLMGIIPLLAPNSLQNKLDIRNSNLDAQNKSLDAQLKQQEFSGQKPYQLGEQQKDLAKSQSDFFSKIAEGSSKEVPVETAKVLANVNSGLKQILSLEQGLESDPDFFKKLRSPGNQTGQSIELMTEDLSDILGRLRSGGAINEDEFKSFIRQIPKRGSFMNFENPKTAKLKLQKLKSLFSEIKKTSEPRSSQFASRVQLALSRGYTKEQIFKTYHGGN